MLVYSAILMSVIGTVVVLGYMRAELRRTGATLLGVFKSEGILLIPPLSALVGCAYLLILGKMLYRSYRRSKLKGSGRR